MFWDNLLDTGLRYSPRNFDNGIYASLQGKSNFMFSVLGIYWNYYGGWELAYTVLLMHGKSSLLYQAWRADGVIGIVIRPAPRLPVSEPVIIIMPFPLMITSRSQQEQIWLWVANNSFYHNIFLYFILISKLNIFLCPLYLMCSVWGARYMRAWAGAALVFVHVECD